MSAQSATALGFIGLGTMGEPMALNLVRAGMSLVVWNRSKSKADALVAAGADRVDSPRDVFDRAATVILMLTDEKAMDAVLERGTPAFSRLVRNRTVVHMGTTALDYSRELAADVQASGGRYVESPVSGSRKPAEAGELVAMLAGDGEAIAAVRPLLAPMCREAIVCGPVPDALSMKLASNLFLITMMTGLTEAVNYADRQGLDIGQFLLLVGAGPLASDLMRMKAPKLVARDFAAQGSVANILAILRMITDVARSAKAAVPLLDTCHALFKETSSIGLHDADLIAVLRAIEERSGRRG